MEEIALAEKVEKKQQQVLSDEELQRQMSKVHYLRRS